MAYLILPSRRTRQPQGFPRLSSRVIRPKYLFSCLYDPAVYEVNTRDFAGVNMNNVSVAMSDRGRVLRGNGQSSGTWVGASFGRGKHLLTGSSACTIFAVFTLRQALAIGGKEYGLIRVDENGVIANAQYALDIISGANHVTDGWGLRGLIATSSSTGWTAMMDHVASGSNLGAWYGKPLFVAVSWVSGSVPLYVYGQVGGALSFGQAGVTPVGSITQTAGDPANFAAHIGGMSFNTCAFPGDIELVGVCDYNANEGTLRQIGTDPYGSLFAEPSWLYTGMGSGSWTPLEVTG